MRWYIIIGTILMAILLTACSVNANAGNSDAETAIVKNENVSGEYTDLVEIIKKAKGTEINLSETTEIILVDGTTGQRIVIDDKDTVKTLVDEFSNTKFTYINEGEESGGYTYRVVFCNNDKTVFDGSFIGDSRISISSKEFISSEKALNSFKVIKEMFASSTDRISETYDNENTVKSSGKLTQNNAEPDETAEKKKLAEKIQKQLPEDIWGGYYVEPKSEDIIEETETTGEKRQYRRVWYELYICILKDYEDLPEYDEVTYKIVEYSADELSDFLAILQNNKEAIGFYDATISYPDNKVILKILENSYINENLLYTLVPEKAIKKTIQKYGISSTVFTKIKTEIQNRTENVNVVCEYDATQLKIRFDVDWIESSDGDYYPDATISLKDYNSYIEIIRVILENLDEIDVNIIIEAGDKADVRSPLRVFVREADSLKRDRLLGLDFGVDGKKLDEDRIKTILEEFSEKIQPDSLKFGIDGYLVNLKLEFNKVPEYSVIEDFYELFGSRLTQAGINAELHISVTDTKGEEIYLIYYPYAYGGYRWAWRKTK